MSFGQQMHTIYDDLVSILDKDSILQEEVTKLGITGSVNDDEASDGWSDLDFLFILKCDDYGNIETNILLRLRDVHQALSQKYPTIEISFLSHTYYDLEKYVAFAYLEHYKFATFVVNKDGLDFKEYIENIIEERNIGENIRKRYSVYHLRHFRFNLMRKVIAVRDDKSVLKMLTDKIIETMILYLNFHGKVIQGKDNRINALSEVGIDESIICIYRKAIQIRKDWSTIEATKDDVTDWIENFKMIESYILKDNQYCTPEELLSTDPI